MTCEAKLSPELSGGGKFYWINIAFDRFSMFGAEESKDSTEKNDGAYSVSDNIQDYEGTLHRCEQPLAIAYPGSAQKTEGAPTFENSISSEETSDTNRRNIFQPSAFDQPFKPIPARPSRIFIRKARSTGAMLTLNEKNAIVRQADFAANLPEVITRPAKTSNEGSESGNFVSPCILRRSSFSRKGKKCQGGKSISDSNLKASVSFDPYVQVLEYRPVQEHMNDGHQGWSRMFTYM